jgi:hypothetical protein
VLVASIVVYLVMDLVKDALNFGFGAYYFQLQQFVKNLFSIFKMHYYQIKTSYWNSDLT